MDFVFFDELLAPGYSKNIMRKRQVKITDDLIIITMNEALWICFGN